jgi:hypothetical protein
MCMSLIVPFKDGTDRQTDRRADRQTDGRTDRQTDGRTLGRHALASEGDRSDVNRRGRGEVKITLHSSFPLSSFRFDRTVTHAAYMIWYDMT